MKNNSYNFLFESLFKHKTISGSSHYDNDKIKYS